MKVIVSRSRVAGVADVCDDSAASDVIVLMHIIGAPHQMSVVIDVLSIVAHLVDGGAAGYAVKELYDLAIGGGRTGVPPGAIISIASCVRPFACRSECVNELAAFDTLDRDHQNIRRLVAGCSDGGFGRGARQLICEFRRDREWSGCRC